MNTGAGQGPVARRAVEQAESVAAARSHWDSDADAYQAEHGEFLGDADFCWGPEGLREADARLLGDVTGQRVLEIGCGAAQCSRWLAGQGARVLGIDISLRQLQHGRRIDERAGHARARRPGRCRRLCPSATPRSTWCARPSGRSPSSPTPPLVMREIARVLAPGGRFAFAVTHPVRWMFLDDGDVDGLVVRTSYFDRRAYVEQTGGRATYVEQHRTMGDRVRELVAAGLVLDDLVEPEWPLDHPRPWGGGWSPLRGALMPGTAIFVGHRP